MYFFFWLAGLVPGGPKGGGAGQGQGGMRAVTLGSGSQQNGIEMLSKRSWRFSCSSREKLYSDEVNGGSN